LIVASLPDSHDSAEGLTFRVAAAADLPQLASWNQQLIEDEGHDNKMSLDELAMRMRTWLATEYQALIFDEPATPADPALLKSQWIPACAGMTAAGSAPTDAGMTAVGSVPAAQERIPACAEMTAAASAPVAYALFRDAPEWIHLRQFFVARDRRRRGIGARAVALLRDTVFPRDKPVIVEAMAWNQPALSFWRAVGFADRYVGLESRPEASVQRSSRNVPS
jgi:GNAT superfamily N-acetyltransferase